MKCFKCHKIININHIYGLHEDCFKEWFGLSMALEFHDLDPKKSSSTLSNVKIRKKKDTFFQGKYLKYSAHLEQIAYILKIQEPEVPDLPAVEYLCNQIAELLNIHVPSYYLINFNSRITFVTRNFMQDYIGTLHHLYKFLPDGEENHNCEEIVKVILTQTGKLAEVVKFIEMCLFDSLIGNNDRHGRNIGIIETASTKKLSPMYDNPSVIGIQEEFLLKADMNPSGSIWTKTNKEPKPRDYIKEFSRLGFEEITRKLCNRIISKSAKIFDVVRNAEIGQLRKDAFMNLIKKRIRDFEDAK